MVAQDMAHSQHFPEISDGVRQEHEGPSVRRVLSSQPPEMQGDWVDPLPELYNLKRGKSPESTLGTRIDLNPYK
ncbi:hypothetical protein FRC20_006797 [Serendipita sp. 405]|nr:hypothetical protein FRC15_009134 [Serendipita sp. 397]KAG8867063.1 hypothetical protein FRC20_006797 [Serendipita sp. 405]